MSDGELTEMEQAAVVMHEMFTAWLHAGFSEEQAVKLLIAMMATTKPLIPPPPSPNGRIN